MSGEGDVLQLLVRIAEAQTVSAVWDHATGYFASLGFGRVNYGYTRFLGSQSLGDTNDAVFLTTTTPEYVRRYVGGGLFSRTPAFKWTLANDGICTWRWIRERFEAGTLSDDEMDALRQNAEMGITAGITVSFPATSKRAKGGLGLIADPGVSEDDVETLLATRGAALQSVAHMMHLKILQLPMPTRRRALTLRQREALEWVADGKTTQDIAILMDVSPAMVEKHLRLARDALGVETTAQAVAKAAFLNMIFQRQAESAKALSVPA